MDPNDPRNTQTMAYQRLAEAGITNPDVNQLNTMIKQIVKERRESQKPAPRFQMPMQGYGMLYEQPILPGSPEANAAIMGPSRERMGAPIGPTLEELGTTRAVIDELRKQGALPDREKAREALKEEVKSRTKHLEERATPSMLFREGEENLPSRPKPPPSAMNDPFHQYMQSRALRGY